MKKGEFLLITAPQDQIQISPMISTLLGVQKHFFSGYSGRLVIKSDKEKRGISIVIPRYKAGLSNVMETTLNYS